MQRLPSQPTLPQRRRPRPHNPERIERINEAINNRVREQQQQLERELTRRYLGFNSDYRRLHNFRPYNEQEMNSSNPQNWFRSFYNTLEREGIPERDRDNLLFQAFYSPFNFVNENPNNYRISYGRHRNQLSWETGTHPEYDIRDFINFL